MKQCAWCDEPLQVDEDFFDLCDDCLLEEQAASDAYLMMLEGDED